MVQEGLASRHAVIAMQADDPVSADPCPLRATPNGCRLMFHPA
jgi:hypothetical protein